MHYRSWIIVQLADRITEPTFTFWERNRIAFCLIMKTGGIFQSPRCSSGSETSAQMMMMMMMMSRRKALVNQTHGGSIWGSYLSPVIMFSSFCSNGAEMSHTIHRETNKPWLRLISGASVCVCVCEGCNRMNIYYHDYITVYHHSIVKMCCRCSKSTDT